MLRSHSPSSKKDQKKDGAPQRSEPREPVVAPILPQSRLSRPGAPGRLEGAAHGGRERRVRGPGLSPGLGRFSFGGSVQQPPAAGPMLSVLPVLGVWPEGSDGTDINAVCRAHEKKVLSTGDDFGKVHLFSYPCSQFRVRTGLHTSHAAFGSSIDRPLSEGHPSGADLALAPRCP